MSLWPAKELRLIVGPDSVTRLSVQRALSVRGVMRRFHDPRTISLEPGGNLPWEPALAALETALAREAGPEGVATVVLSNKWVRYVLVPWRAELADAQEDLSYARHCFSKVYGKVCLDWEIRIGRQAPGRPRVSSAIDTALLAGIKRVFDKAGTGLRSIQPHLMAAFNQVRGQLRQRSAWIALLEPGHLCVAMLHEGQWARVHSLRIAGPWREELLQALERECFLADEGAVPRDVYVGTLDDAVVAPAETGPWRLHPLRPGGTDVSGAGDRLVVAANEG